MRSPGLRPTGHRRRWSNGRYAWLQANAPCGYRLLCAQSRSCGCLGGSRLHNCGEAVLLRGDVDSISIYLAYLPGDCGTPERLGTLRS